MTANSSKRTMFLITMLPLAMSAHADNADTANKSNNPLNLAPGANLQDYYTPNLYDTNDALLRGTLPISTRPDPHDG